MKAIYKIVLGLMCSVACSSPDKEEKPDSGARLKSGDMSGAYRKSDRIPDISGTEGR